MRKIHKGNCPSILAANASSDLLRMESVLLNGENPNADSKIYAHADVKTALKDCFHKKCAYCERFLNGDYGDVEHFRPKMGYINTETGGIVRPGYWWLAYDWDNLLLSCSECNRSYKQNNFPLENENQRNIAAKDITREHPMLINPVEEDPSDNIEFNRWIILPKIIEGVESPKGKKTINVLKLNERPDLVEKRRRRWEEVRAAKQVGLNVSAWIDDASEFTGMFENQI